MALRVAARCCEPLSSDRVPLRLVIFDLLRNSETTPSAKRCRASNRQGHQTDEPRVLVASAEPSPLVATCPACPHLQSSITPTHIPDGNGTNARRHARSDNAGETRSRRVAQNEPDLFSGSRPEAPRSRLHRGGSHKRAPLIWVPRPTRSELNPRASFDFELRRPRRARARKLEPKELLCLVSLLERSFGGKGFCSTLVRRDEKQTRKQHGGKGHRYSQSRRRSDRRGWVFVEDPSGEKASHTISTRAMRPALPLDVSSTPITIPQLGGYVHRSLGHPRQPRNDQTSRVIVQTSPHIVAICDRVLLHAPNVSSLSRRAAEERSELTSFSSTSVHQNSTPSHSPFPRGSFSLYPRSSPSR